MSSTDQDTTFREIKSSVKADEKGRVIVDGKIAGKQFRVSVSQAGDYLLTPVVTIPEREMWLHTKSDASDAFYKGLTEAAEGKVSEPMDFSAFAALDDEDE